MTRPAKKRRARIHLLSVNAQAHATSGAFGPPFMSACGTWSSAMHSTARIVEVTCMRCYRSKLGKAAQVELALAGAWFT